MAIQLARITQRQAPQFRALIVNDEDGSLFDPSQLATQQDLDDEGIDAFPISCSVYKSTKSIAPYSFATSQATPVSGFTNVEISSDAFIDVSGVEDPSYNFAVVLENRVNFAFEESGVYFVDFLLYPKTGAALAWRVGVEVG